MLLLEGVNGSASTGRIVMQKIAKMQKEDEWIRASDAVDMLKPILSEYGARIRICERAHAGIVRAKAEHFHEGDKRYKNHNIPEKFWWAEGHASLTQDWSAGDFSTSIRDHVRLKAFGVTFARADIEKIVPPPVTVNEGTPVATTVTKQKRRLAAIVALDVAGYSARTERNEAKTAAQVAILRNLVEAIAVAYDGRVFNTAGDGFMLEFSSSVDAVDAAIDLADKCTPSVRIGVHSGDVVVQATGDLLGHAVNVAARLMALAEPGSLRVSSDVQRAIHGPLAQSFRSLGKCKLDKMVETVEVFELTRGGTPTGSPNKAPIGSSATDKEQILRDIVWLREALLSYRSYSSFEVEAWQRYSRLDNSDNPIWTNSNLNQLRRDFVNRCGIVLDERRRGAFIDQVTRSEIETIGAALLAFVID